MRHSRTKKSQYTIISYMSIAFPSLQSASWRLVSLNSNPARRPSSSYVTGTSMGLLQVS